ncbi:YtzI protein [Thermaerobacillus caldiproteolyticus]|uniref:Cell division protein FtsL n=1 Tax=Thermaerobacillus caldiproteolyticus TaxID=247480 RepID=A0A7V9Z4J7_9BACL|nr:YtzI protein [Anoxybacillus caldiproteolyticus]MBA2873899.1 cell division protein FtsL [Anoxybacillus caldiproteolyticus]QPA30446.1 YtzI protein [Anoxybacillus caldiproteolyticus]
MYTVLIISLIIVALVLALSVATTSKAYQYKHTVDPLENNPYVQSEKADNQENGANQ